MSTHYCIYCPVVDKGAEEHYMLAKPASSWKMVERFIDGHYSDLVDVVNDEVHICVEDVANNKRYYYILPIELDDNEEVVFLKNAREEEGRYLDEVGSGVWESNREDYEAYCKAWRNDQ